jgi:hypothetical protein
MLGGNIDSGELSFIEQLFSASTTSKKSSSDDVAVAETKNEEEDDTKTTEFGAQTTSYERRRLENISRNNEAMRRFGITPTEVEEAPLRQVEETKIEKEENENAIEIVDEIRAHRSLLHRWPGRERHIQNIEDACGTGHPGGYPALPGFAVYGREANSTCDLVVDTLSEFKLRYCYVDCSLISTSRQLYHSILAQLSPSDRGTITGMSSSNPGNFVRAIQKVSSQNKDRALYVVLDRAQKLAPLNMSIFSLHLGDQVFGSNVCLICVSEVELRGHLSELRAVTRLKDLNEKDAVTMLCRKRKREEEEKKKDEKNYEDEDNNNITDLQYRVFVQTIYRSSIKFCRDIREISFLIDVLLPKLRVVCNKRTTPREVAKHVTDFLKLRGNHFVFGHDLDLFEGSVTQQTRIARNFPVRERILLVAAFLSSWNPAGTDAQFRAIQSNNIKSKRKRRKRVSSASSRDWEKIRLKGPQTFSFYRLWDNFKAMLTCSDLMILRTINSDRAEEKENEDILEMLEPTNAHDFALVNTLVDCHLLQQTSTSVLNPRYRCIAPKRVVDLVARTVCIKLDDHLLTE